MDLSAVDIFMGCDVVAGRLGIVVGMASEARLLGGTDYAVGVGGGTAIGALRMAEHLVADGAAALISFGLAGGLDPALAAGTALVPRAVLSRGKPLACDERFRDAFSGESIALLLATDTIIASVEEKQRLWRETAAGAADMESGAVAEVATAAGIPFAVFRVVCDSAVRSLPSAALDALDLQGRIAPRRMARVLARHPGQILGLIALGRDAARARRTLIRGAESLGRLAASDADLGRLVP